MPKQKGRVSITRTFRIRDDVDRALNIASFALEKTKSQLVEEGVVLVLEREKKTINAALEIALDNQDGV